MYSCFPLDGSGAGRCKGAGAYSIDELTLLIVVRCVSWNTISRSHEMLINNIDRTDQIPI